MTEELPDPEERREAEALARMLDGDRDPGGAHPEELEAIELLRASAPHPPLGDEGLDRVWQRIDGRGVGRPRVPIATRAIVVVTAAAALLFAFLPTLRVSEPAGSAELSPTVAVSVRQTAPSVDPRASLVAAQRAVLANGDDDAFARLEAASAAYRDTWLETWAEGRTP